MRIVTSGSACAPACDALRRIVTAEDIANAVFFLSSDQAAAITGVCLPVDCGLTAGQAELARTFSQSDNY